MNKMSLETSSQGNLHLSFGLASLPSLHMAL